MRKFCAECGEQLTGEEERLLALDTDFVYHGQEGARHLIRVEPSATLDAMLSQWDRYFAGDLSLPDRLTRDTFRAMVAEIAALREEVRQLREDVAGALVSGGTLG